MSKNVFDYVIVGAGSAGCVLAARLSEDPAVRVAVVEAGGPDTNPDIKVPYSFFKLMGTDDDWAFRSTPQSGMADREMFWPRGRTLGGSSSVNAQMWIPGHSEDYGPWAEATKGLWSWEAVEPYFRKSERWAGDPGRGASYGTEGPLWISEPRDPDPTTERFLDACAEAGLPELVDGLGGADHTGCAVTPLNQLRGERWSAADGYLRPALARDNLTVLTGTQVRRVLLKDGRATGVETDRDTLSARREIVLSAGTVGSPHLLMLSGIGDPEELRRAGVAPVAALPGVGRNLQDHLTLNLLMEATVPVPLADAYTPANRLRYERDRLGPLTSNIAEAVAFFRGDGGPGAPDLELIWAPIPFTDHGTAVRQGLTLGVILLQPQSRGRITLDAAAPTAAPLIDPGYFTAEEDLRVFLSGLRFAERLFTTKALAPLVSGPMAPWPGTVDDAGLARTVQQHGDTLYHPVGTCRMGGADDEQAVVDPYLRVHGVTGLRVADASVMPTITRGHTHAPAVMIGERAADLIRGAR
ncbi:GMC family oxidoreductase N-terminal domain-containing protein [Streptomyces sp. B-S-A8]|uniref:GMC family oxidoreductase N-terminal domain-containing protein n=1 Tax=Streptomyces solicavernae TaxID=3043614 RepID=A0ABT6RZW2_9ACTN|nr:GMC family oxidoreductase N-terminal domain-containing protein [Streptomyces sp. B-S-A8]MDI3389965.1 GMC family oxidoreductase N-terminal domain-containing protein [Streptomyces sp. B-S-A8]